MRSIIVLVLLCPLLSMAQPLAPNGKVRNQQANPANATTTRKHPTTTNHQPPTTNPPLQSSVIRHLSSLSIGDTLPSGILNHKLQTTNHKLLILDFFATWCASCIKELPKLNGLQQQYNGRLQVVLVTYEKEQTIRAFKKKNRVFAASTLPLITGDTVLRALFPHKTLPHTVWIGPEGKVLAITYPQEVNVANITAALERAPLRLPLKKDILDFDSNKPLLLEGNGGTEDLLIGRSQFTRYMEGLFSGSFTARSRDSLTRRIVFINQPLLRLYLAATGFRYPANRIVIESRDTTRFIRNPLQPWNTWASVNAFCYELTLPATVNNTAVERLMLQDLDRYLGLRGRVEKRRIPCWVLRCANGEAVLPPSTGEQPAASLLDSEGKPKFLVNTPLSVLVQALNQQVVTAPLRPIVLDETGHTAPVDLQFTAALDNLPALREQLRPYGLDLVPAERELEVLVISDDTSFFNR